MYVYVTYLWSYIEDFETRVRPRSDVAIVLLCTALLIISRLKSSQSCYFRDFGAFPASEAFTISHCIYKNIFDSIGWNVGYILLTLELAVKHRDKLVFELYMILHRYLYFRLYRAVFERVEERKM